MSELIPSAPPNIFIVLDPTFGNHIVPGRKRDNFIRAKQAGTL